MWYNLSTCRLMIFVSEQDIHFIDYQFGIGQCYCCIYVNLWDIYCNGFLTVNNAPTLNITFICSILNLLFDSATAAYIYIYGNTYCNVTLAANNALTLNNTSTPSIFNSVYDTAMEPWQWIIHKLETARSLNRFSIRYTTLLLEHILTFMGTPIAMEPLKQIMH